MRAPLRALARLIPFVSLFALASFLTACGSYETTKIKDYRMHVVGGTPAQVAEFKKLIQDFNGFAGRQALVYVNTPEEANSPIIMTKGLKAKTGDKVGLGQWLADSEQDNPMTTSPGSRPQRTVRFSMRLEFDQDYFDLHKSAEEVDVYAKQKLFFHEVGHGLELGHAPEQGNLMYEEISGKKDFDGFFKYVQSYMSDT